MTSIVLQQSESECKVVDIFTHFRVSLIIVGKIWSSSNCYHAQGSSLKVFILNHGTDSVQLPQHSNFLGCCAVSCVDVVAQGKVI